MACTAKGTEIQNTAPTTLISQQLARFFIINTFVIIGMEAYP